MSFATAGGTAPLRGVVVGAGALGPHWGYELHHSGDVVLAGWVDLLPERAAAAAVALGAHEVPVGADLAAMLDAVRPDFIVNVSPPVAHHAITLAALERGLHVLSEKPMAATLAQAADMIAAADRNERLLMVSQNRRYYPGLVAFRDTVAQLGALSNLTCQFFIAHRDDAAEFLLTFPDPLLLDMAIHLFDGARAITGADPLTVYCEASNPPWSWYDARRRMPRQHPLAGHVPRGGRFGADRAPRGHRYPRGMSQFEPGDVVRAAHPDTGDEMEGTYLAEAEPGERLEVDGEPVDTVWVELDDGETRKLALDGVRAV